MEGGAQSWKGTEGRRGRRGSQRETRMGQGSSLGLLDHSEGVGREVTGEGVEVRTANLQG
jgi:hypothetical protein